tara:strand:+ start:561 stop:851 length:291 start_codon:yes stop_codon:yes gene_type:complete
MGATTFQTLSSGATPDDAFDGAVSEAKYYYGHGGYTGTIAEKNTFTMATTEQLTKTEAYKLASSLISTKYSSKWGPAGCIKINEPELYLFFGWASE